MRVAKVSGALASVLLAVTSCLAQQTPLSGSQFPSSPEVSYQDGKLRINARNATLSQILSLVAQRTGAVLEGPTERGQERVVVQLGPATVSEVLSQLLQGSPFDYVILGSAARNGTVEKIVLSPRSSGAGNPMQAGRFTPPPPPPPPVEEPEIVEEVPPMPGMEPSNVGAPPGPGALEHQGMTMQPPSNAPPVYGENPGMPNSDPNATGTPLYSNPPDQQAPSDPQLPKTPEQLLRELQMMQQQDQAGRQNQ